MKLQIINGPNLNLLGKREPEIYGTDDFESYLLKLRRKYHDTEISYFQSNVEGEIINRLHECDNNCGGIIMNAAGYTHTSVAIGDAIAAITTAVIEVHISNVFARESFRHLSMLSAHCKGIITGFGLYSYDLAVRAFLEGK
jgi:3-dehydroquinate dehydratase-2